VKRAILTALSLAAFCATSLPVLTQARQGSLASLIQKGDRKAALEKIRAGADVNEAQPDGTRPITGRSSKSITNCSTL
jgi:hypothetical protein